MKKQRESIANYSLDCSCWLMMLIPILMLRLEIPLNILYLLEIEVRPLGLIFILQHYHCCPL